MRTFLKVKLRLRLGINYGLRQFRIGRVSLQETNLKHIRCVCVRVFAVPVVRKTSNWGQLIQLGTAAVTPTGTQLILGQLG